MSTSDPAPPLTLWLCIGDAGGYEEFDDLRDASDALLEADARPPFTDRPGGLGFTCPGYEGRSYVSAYWGPDAETPVRGLTEDELTELGELTLDAPPNAIEDGVTYFAKYQCRGCRRCWGMVQDACGAEDCPDCGRRTNAYAGDRIDFDDAPLPPKED